MRSNAVGGRLLNSSLAWDGAVMMPLQYMVWYTVTQAKTTLVEHIPTTINEDPTTTS
jgi:hypothetical protein